MKEMNLMWSQGTLNWGDYCNPKLFKMLSGEESHYVPMGEKNLPPHYMMVGSILHLTTPETEVWGAGLRFSKGNITPPKKIHAVRGPLTRKILVKKGIKCPAIYGDPVLLLPRFYKPSIEKKYKLGVIPHYVDKDIIKEYKDSSVLLIDIQEEFYKVINDVNSCERIVSGSLHGLILADAYGIPAMRLKMSDRVEGADLKFNDYFLSVHRKKNEFIDFYSLKYITDSLKYFYDYKIEINLDKLYRACPFRKEIIQK